MYIGVGTVGEEEWGRGLDLPGWSSLLLMHQGLR